MATQAKKHMDVFITVDGKKRLGKICNINKDHKDLTVCDVSVLQREEHEDNGDPNRKPHVAFFIERGWPNAVLATTEADKAADGAWWPRTEQE